MSTTTIRAVSALVLGCFLALGAPAQQRFDFDRTPGHLPKTALPTHYRLTLHLDPQAEVFSGEALISVRVRQPVPAIVLHAHKLVAGTAVLEQGSGERGLTMHSDESTQTWRLVPSDAQPIAPGEYRLRLAYSGKVNRSGAALFQAPHQVQGQPARMLATQLQAIFARRVFPGFDEPAFRIAFDLAVRAPQGYEVLSNMPATSRVDEGGPGGGVLHRFATTPPMPSYLLAVAVGRFDMLHGSAAGVPLRIVTAPGKRELAAYAMASTQALLPYFNDYFGVPYALPKLDQIAVPSTRGGAMEDWGLISYAEQYLLFDPASSDTQTRQDIFRIVAHEVAHQWFGNLVTAASWEEIWLNEAFATWLAAKAMERFNPEWQTRLRQRQWIDYTMVRDAGAATRAIRSGAVSEDRVSDVFDGITYTKGGAVLSMLEQWIGPDSFRRGLAGYMRAQQYSNATAGDLWFHIGKASNRDIAAVAASWTDQPGFPLVSVATRCERGRTHVHLRQRRFSTDGAESPALWQIPLVLLHGNARSTVVLRSERQTLLLQGCPAQPLLLNAGGEGFYRVAYAPPQQAALVRSFARLPDSARITLLSDTFALAQAGQLPMAAFLELLTEVPKAQGAGRSALYAQARSGLDFLAGALAGTPQQAALEDAARTLFVPELAALGWTPKAGESSETESLRNLLIEDLARYGDTATLDRARALFDAEQAGGAALPPGIRAGVMRAVGVQPGNARFEQLWARLLATASEEERSLYASALAEVRDPVLAQRLLALSLQGTLPTNQASQLPGLVAERRHNAEMAYRFTLSNWPALAELAGPVGRVWLLPSAAEGFNRLEQAQALLADQQRVAGAPGASPAARIAARIELMAAVQSREAGAMDADLRKLKERLAPAGR